MYYSKVGYVLIGNAVKLLPMNGWIIRP